MALRPGDCQNFDTLRRAFENGDAALMECVDGEENYVAVICAVTYDTDKEEFVLTPFARMFDGNPYDEVTPVADVARHPAEANFENTS